MGRFAADVYVDERLGEKLVEGLLLWWSGCHCSFYVCCWKCFRLVGMAGVGKDKNELADFEGGDIICFSC